MFSTFGHSRKEDNFYPLPHHLMSVKSKIRQARFVAGKRTFRNSNKICRRFDGRWAL